MCLAIPGKIISLNKKLAKVNFNGVTRDVAMDLLPEAKIGDYVLVHAGFAIERVDERQALETIKIFEEIYAD